MTVATITFFALATITQAENDDSSKFADCKSGLGEEAAPPTSCDAFKDNGLCITHPKLSKCCPLNCKRALVCKAASYVAAATDDTASNALTQCMEQSYESEWTTLGFGTWLRTDYNTCEKILGNAEGRDVSAYKICCAIDPELKTQYACDAEDANLDDPTLKTDLLEEGTECAKLSECKAPLDCKKKAESDPKKVCTGKRSTKPEGSAANSLGLALTAALAVLAL